MRNIMLSVDVISATVSFMLLIFLVVVQVVVLVLVLCCCWWCCPGLQLFFMVLQEVKFQISTCVNDLHKKA